MTAGHDLAFGYQNLWFIIHPLPGQSEFLVLDPYSRSLIHKHRIAKIENAQLLIIAQNLTTQHCLR